MVNNHHMPQKHTEAALETRSEAQAIQKVIEAVLPEIFNYRGEVHLNITVHFHCRDIADLAGD